MNFAICCPNCPYVIFTFAEDQIRLTPAPVGTEGPNTFQPRTLLEQNRQVPVAQSCTVALRKGVLLGSHRCLTRMFPWWRWCLTCQGHGLYTRCTGALGSGTGSDGRCAGCMAFHQPEIWSVPGAERPGLWVFGLGQSSSCCDLRRYGDCCSLAVSLPEREIGGDCQICQLDPRVS